MCYLSTFCLVLLFSLFHHLISASSQQEPGFCEAPFQCGNIAASFPFWGGNRDRHCGHPLLKLNCNKNNTTSLTISDTEYSVLHLNQTSKTLTLVRPDLVVGSFCSSLFTNTTLAPDIFELSPAYKSVTVFYQCDSLLPSLSSYTCPDKGPISASENPDSPPDTCRASFTMNVPASFDTKEKTLNITNLESVLRKGFEVKVMIDEKPCQECSSSRGKCETITQLSTCRPLNSAGAGACGYNQTSSRFICYCKDPYSLSCGRTAPSQRLLIITGVVLGFIVIGCCLLAWYLKTKNIGPPCIFGFRW